MTNTDTNTQAQAPAAAGPAPESSAPQGDKRESVAKHELIIAPGGEHTEMTKAVGIRYTDRRTGAKFEYLIPNAQPGTASTMLALFGAKTKATNEASRVRNGEKGTPDEEMEAIDEVFANLDKGVWREKAEGGGGSRTDKALLAEVIVASLGDKANAGGSLFYQHRLENEDGYLKKVMSVDAIKNEYRKRAGKTGPDVTTIA